MSHSPSLPSPLRNSISQSGPWYKVNKKRRTEREIKRLGDCEDEEAPRLTIEEERLFQEVSPYMKCLCGLLRFN